MQKNNQIEYNQSEIEQLEGLINNNEIKDINTKLSILSYLSLIKTIEG